MFKLIVMCNLYNTINCISIMKSCKPKFYCNLNDRVDFCIVCQELDKILYIYIYIFIY